MKLRSHLIVLTVVTLVPMLVFTGLLVGMLRHSLTSAHEVGLRSTTRAIASAVNEQMVSALTVLQLLAASEDFGDEAPPPERLEKLERLVAQQRWRALFLVARDGRQVFNTGTQTSDLPRLQDLDYVHEVFETERPFVSGYRVSRTLRTPNVVIAVPVRVQGVVRYVLAASLPLEPLSELLRVQAIPGDWTAAVLDDQMRIVARSRRPEEFVGRPATPRLAERARAEQEAVFEDVTQEGVAAYGAFFRSPATGWTVVLGLPAESLVAPVRRSVWGILAAAFVVLCVGVLLATTVGKRIAEPINALARAAAQIGSGTSGPPIGTGIAEVGQVSRALTVADMRLAEERQTIDTLNQIGKGLAAELELQPLLQRLTDEATALTGAEFGAFFNARHVPGGELTLYTLSGAEEEAFSRFPAPRATHVFGPTFRGEGTVRSDDITQDPRYGRNPPYHGMPEGHLPVRSYLAVPVVSRTGEVLGGLFFGHSSAGVFTARHEQMLIAVAAQAAIAIDNAVLYRKAQEAIQLRDDFLSVASHELKTPLTPLTLQLDALMAKQRSAPEAAVPVSTLERMRKQVSRLSRLVEELLDVSRIASGRLELFPAPMDLAVVIRDIAASFEQQRLRSGCTFHLGGDDSLPGEFDRGRVEQVVSNLITNALKYGAGKPIEITTRAEGDWAVVTVRDHGIGIQPEDQARIFERFERAVSGRHYGGLGLGLWIVRRVVETAGGTVQVQSQPGEGASFVVRLPVRPPVSSTPSAEEPGRAAG